MSGITLQQFKCPAIRFEKRAVEDRNATIERGMRVTRDVDLVFVKQIGERDETERDAKEWLKSLRAKAESAYGMAASVPIEWCDRADMLYEQWKKGNEEPIDGFSIREWPILSPSQIANMLAMKTYTVQQVAEWSESALGMFGIGSRELRDKARLWLQSGDEKAEQISALRVENAALKKEGEELRLMLKRLSEDVDKLKQEDKPARGRPRSDHALTKED